MVRLDIRDSDCLAVERDELHGESLAVRVHGHDCPDIPRIQAVFGDVNRERYDVMFPEI